ncbi:glycosyltransferase family 8 protein [Peniophora sp. CONT]|nr:glycosyltransferase family 8 protein [Peniophora sp. CONT]
MSAQPQKDDSKYRFTASQDWFSHNAPAWRDLFPLVTSRTKAPRALEIGSWEGRSAVFLLEELCGSDGTLLCIDHFDLFRTPTGKARFETVQHNLRASGAEDRTRVIADFSVPALMRVLREEIALDEGKDGKAGFDFLYIDGSHEADDTMLDGELAWRLARKGAIVIFDDYGWETEPVGRHHPKPGIDAFMTLHAGEFERLSSEEQYQMVLRKTSDMRIGFLVADGGEKQVEYGINVVYTIDAAYAMPLAVSLRSLLEHTPGRISAYIFVHSVPDDVRAKIRDSLPKRDDLTLQFFDLNADALAVKAGSCWAKIDMLGLLPVERALYLDADTLVRTSVRPLWETDLRGHSLAAAQDVGYPLGHAVGAPGTSREPYFNAGVLLLDLAQVRTSVPDLKAVALEKLSGRYADQDALNAHFSQHWIPLPLKWNAQGLGTYADMQSPEREALSIKSMTNEAAVVHFTGPVHPTMNAVLNDWGQPYTAKPWGYAGSPGHPYAQEWWATLKLTVWGNWRASSVYKDEMNGRKSRALEVGVKEFDGRVTAARESGPG